jgi:hypothetical protein
MPFELWRQDDNGNRFLVDTYDNLAEAEKRLAELSRIPHKQTYWITKLVEKKFSKTRNCR